MNKAKKVVKYRASEYGKRDVFTIRINGVKVGVGGSGKVVPEPPGLPYVIREATSEEYELLHGRGLKKWIDRYEEKEQISEPEQPDTGAA